MNSTHKYPALISIETILRVVAWVFFALGALALVGAFARLSNEGAAAMIASFGVGLGIVFAGVLALAYAEMIQVVVDIEENTRLGKS